MIYSTDHKCYLAVAIERGISRPQGWGLVGCLGLVGVVP